MNSKDPWGTTTIHFESWQKLPQSFHADHHTPGFRSWDVSCGAVTSRGRPWKFPGSPAPLSAAPAFSVRSLFIIHSAADPHPNEVGTAGPEARVALLGLLLTKHQ